MTQTMSTQESHFFFPAGKLLISLELLPKDAADAQAVGSGRNEPNQNPYLPPPAGRMKFSVNPFRIAMDLLGVKAFYKVRCGVVQLRWGAGATLGKGGVGGRTCLSFAWLRRLTL